MNEFDVCIKKNFDAYPDLYIAFRQREITGPFEKCVLKIVISKDISSNAQIFNSHFVNKIKDLDTDKAYEKSCLVV